MLFAIFESRSTLSSVLNNGFFTGFTATDTTSSSTTAEALLIMSL